MEQDIRETKQSPMYGSKSNGGYDLLAAGETEEALEVLQSCADVLSQQGRRADAIPLRRRELAWTREQNGDTDLGTLMSIN
jgi:hypothetical protein